MTKNKYQPDQEYGKPALYKAHWCPTQLYSRVSQQSKTHRQIDLKLRDASKLDNKSTTYQDVPKV